ncbi:glucose-1-phosphate thymidylyltransferase RfbA [Shewanella sp. Scap07]|uniref:glucose-1-phosphate thymidylyltransferase RfbA n=1 Tax=Shewanella sp. Scap07 TaxID=2589987 RepID=UPI0015BFA885|nr:glucose-1-phosphate thymidylyltransferase RfbA [Shewanella sp. Scap07]QLE86061.1 glucose-1-phosphate thymidylyltransferase RfbA [Shewanella sp. Scap07]
MSLQQYFYKTSNNTNRLNNVTEKRKGIILAGGSGTRLYPITRAISKQLVPVYDKPMIYYPLSTLMLAGIDEILIITTAKDQPQFIDLLGNGNQWGIDIQFAIQAEPNGLAEALTIGEDFLQESPCALILGDNIFYARDFSNVLKSANDRLEGATVFGYHVADPERYGIVEFDTHLKVISVEEKPLKPKSNYALTGLYFFDKHAVEYAKKLTPSERGELEITDLNRVYLNNNQLFLEMMGRGTAWLDTGTHDSLAEATQLIATIERSQGLKVACPEEVAYRRGFINKQQLIKLANEQLKSGYGKYLLQVIDDPFYQPVN